MKKQINKQRKPHGFNLSYALEEEKAKWEHMVLLELVKEYHYIARIHKITLLTDRHTHIRLTDTRRVLGSWNPELNEICISRKLIQKYSWFQVLGVLQHEMAHQLAWLSKSNKNSDLHSDSDSINNQKHNNNHMPHGPEFQAACEQLGVPHQFRTATVDLLDLEPNEQEEENEQKRSEAKTGTGAAGGPDWQQQDPSVLFGEENDQEATLRLSNERMIERVKKLLQLATTTNEHEAFLAMSKVREIFARYNLDSAKILHHEDMARNLFSQNNKTRTPKRIFVHTMINTKKKKLSLMDRKIINILGDHFFVRVITSSIFDAEDLESYCGIELIGTRENVLMSEYVFYFLQNQINFLSQQRKSQQQNFKGTAALRSFKVGILDGFKEKLRAQEKPNPTVIDHQANQDISKALVLFRKDKAFDSYIQTCFPRLISRRSSSSPIDYLQWSAGADEGRRLNLHKAVHNNQPSKRNLQITGR